MRVVPLLTVALLIGIAAAAGTVQHAELAKHLEAASKMAGRALGGIGKSLEHNALGKSLLKASHAFQAQQTSGSCDQAKFADATARVLQACPALSGLISGSTTLEDFLPGFCGSECYNTLNSQLAPNAACLTEETYFLVTLIQGCQTRPQCYSEAFVGVNAKITKDCGDVSRVVSLTNITAAAEADVAALCAGTCVSRQVALMRQFPECIIDTETGATLPATAIAGLMEGACKLDNGTYCAVKLKAFGKFNCEDRCYSSNSWCSGYCTPAVTTDRLNTLCSPCTEALTKNLGALSDEADLLVGSLNLMCSTANGGAYTSSNPYCYPLAMNMYTTFEADRSLPTNATMATYCAGSTAKCTDRVINAASALAVTDAKSTFVSCLTSYSYSYYSSYQTSYCLPTLERNLREAEQMRVAGNALCAQNANGDFCMWRIYDLISDFTVGCTDVATDVTSAGCCLPLWNDMVRLESTSFAATYLPSGTRTAKYYSYTTYNTTTFTYTHTSLYSRPSLTRAQQPANNLLTCSAVSNSSDFWALVESPCPSMLAAPPKREITVNLAWARVIADAALRANIEASLRADTAAAMGVAITRVINGSLAENTAVAIQLRSETRRATATGSGCKYVFNVDGASEAEATAAATRLDSAISAGTFVTPTTSATVQTQCTECMDARATNFAQAATPVDGSSPSSSSSATGVSTFAAAIAAIVVAAML